MTQTSTHPGPSMVPFLPFADAEALSQNEQRRARSAAWHILHAARQIVAHEAELRSAGDVENYCAYLESTSYAKFHAAAEYLEECIGVLDREAAQEERPS